MADVQIQNHQQLVEDNHKFDGISDKFQKTLTLESESSPCEINDEEQRSAENDDETLTQHSSTSAQNINEDEEDEESGEFEFCFFGEAIKSPVSAEEVFEDGQIRIISPFSGEPSGSDDGPPVKKLFVVSTSPENDDVAEGPYCVWESPSPTPEMSKKSNSTGFSKLWKVRDLLSRSNSDGKDAYVFLKNDDASNTTSFFRKRSKVKLEKIDVRKRGEKDKKESSSSSTTSFESSSSSKTTFESSSSSSKTSLKKKKSAYEVLYGENKKKGGGGGKSYLPYRQDLVGFFTNGSGMSRNVHPY